MKRVIREVLPTDCSPRKTSLNLRRGFEKDVSAIVLCWLERVNFHSGFELCAVGEAAAMEFETRDW
jgi:hypothetical protein